EILIVIALIVLFITLALPAFNLISGNRSIAGATNQVSAMLGRARAEALGTQQIRGVGFYVDAAGRSTMCIVHQPFQENPTTVAAQNGSNGTFTAGTYGQGTNNYWVTDGTTWYPADQNAIDIEADTDVLPLPNGVGAMLINNGGGQPRTSNGYVSFGAILFDANGSLVSRNISIAQHGIIGKNANNIPNLPPSGSIASQFGVVLFDQAAFTGAGGSMSPQTIWFGTTYNQKPQDDWLDQNATPLLINRFNGTLVRAQ
ncbi:MAG: hypothetical protein JO353_14050, partial [Phycisphaerae bacterium]|nr:hypothetical protein [Phycisphaerae bacterium]